MSAQIRMSAERVGFSYGSRPVLEAVDLEIRPGRLHGVLGANGAGKSTLLKLFAGDLTPTAGRLRLGQADLAGVSPLAQARVRAVMPQASELRFALTGRQVVALGRSPHRATTSRRRNEQIVLEALALVDALAFSERPYPTLSGGERQRVALARALAQIMPLGETERFLLLDEPTANLDIEHQQSTLAVARALSREGIGVLAVLHDLNLAAQYCDGVSVVHDGTIALEGTPSEVFTPADIERCFRVRATVLEHPSGACPLVVTGPKSPAPFGSTS